MLFIYWFIFLQQHFYLYVQTWLTVLLFKNHLIWVSLLQLSLLFPFYLQYFIKIFKDPHFFELTYLFLTLITFFLSLHENIFNLKFHNFLHILYEELLIFQCRDFISFSLIVLYDDAFYENLFLFLIYHK
jgi:hypothetical protein